MPKVEKNTSVLDAAKLMKEKDAGFLPVSEGGSAGKMIGTHQGTPYWTSEDADTQEASKMMVAEKQVRRLPVINKEKKLVGVVSLGDISSKAPEKHAAEAVKGVSQTA
ncbi:hypothetical protein HDU93_000124 [Gonapodya sp. JEL0774]|nr:hypothetical protein HDU93_000124 [Gonapodya sp. JEL0774]